MFLFLTHVLICVFSTHAEMKTAWEINLGANQTALYGDMTLVLTPRQLLRYGDRDKEPVRGVSIKETAVNRWINNILPFELSPRYTDKQKQAIISAMKDLEAVSCFKFVKRQKERDYINLIPLDGCYSYVGKIGGRQTVSLSADCIADYIIWHELMHAMGFEHEHQRPDRDFFIKVEYRNVMPGQMVNFEKLSATDVDYPDTYDYKSIMHYDGFAFGKMEKRRRLATMVPTKRGMQLEDNLQMSRTDIRKLNRIGKCGAPNVKPATSSISSTIAGCRNLNAACQSMKSRGLCTMPFYRPTMERQCPLACGLCSRSRALTHDEIDPETTCADMKSNCQQFAYQCKDRTYREIMMTLCPVTCGMCGCFLEYKDTALHFLGLVYGENNAGVRLRPANRFPLHNYISNRSLVADDGTSSATGNIFVSGSDLNCPTYVKNNFCTDDFYSPQVRRLRCAKSCGLC